MDAMREVLAALDILEMRSSFTDVMHHVRRCRGSTRRLIYFGMDLLFATIDHAQGQTLDRKPSMRSFHDVNRRTHSQFPMFY
jgi:hypothetical protein